MKSLPIGFALATLCAVAGAGSWSTDTYTDRMSGKTETHASIGSNNSLSLAPPYSGRNYGTLTVRKHPKYGLDVLLQFEQGQTLCNSFDPCRVAVKFDDNKPVTFTGLPPSDHSTTTIFLQPESRFIAGASKAKRILVQFPVYQGGEQIFEFSTSTPLKWQPAK